MSIYCSQAKHSPTKSADINISTENILIVIQMENTEALTFTQDIDTHTSNTLSHTNKQSKMYGGEVAVEVAVNLSRAVILNLDTRRHWRAFWRGRADLRRQQGCSLGRSGLCSEARGPQGGHRREDSGAAAGCGVCMGVR